jgi:hypothetical protein
MKNNLQRPPQWLTALHERLALVRVLVNAPGREIQSVEELFTRREQAKVREGFALFFAELRALKGAVAKDGASLALAVLAVPLPARQGCPAAFGPGGDRGVLQGRAAGLPRPAARAAARGRRVVPGLRPPERRRSPARGLGAPRERARAEAALRARAARGPRAAAVARRIRSRAARRGMLGARPRRRAPFPTRR